jgi:O-antigen ligase
LITVLITSAKELKIALILIVLSLGLEGAKQGWAQLILNPGATNTNEIPFLGDNNCVAIGMLMLVPLLFALGQTAKSKWMKSGYIFLIIGVSYRALSTYSRGGMIAFAGMCIIWWLRSRHKIQSILAIALIAALTLPVFPPKFWDRMKTITANQEEMDSSSASRLYSGELDLKWRRLIRCSAWVITVIGQPTTNSTIRVVNTAQDGRYTACGLE